MNNVSSDAEDLPRGALLTEAFSAVALPAEGGGGATADEGEVGGKGREDGAGFAESAASDGAAGATVADGSGQRGEAADCWAALGG